jgi:hypothetical protein
MSRLRAVPPCVVKCSLSNAIGQVTWVGLKRGWDNLPRVASVSRWHFVAGREGTYLLARFVFFALRGLTLDALDCLNRLPFLAFGNFTA